MPIYEYSCQDCRRVVSIFFRSLTTRADPACPECGGMHLQRKISRVIIAKGDRRRLDEAETGRLMAHYGGTDKGSQAFFARKMAAELGEAGADFKQMAEKVEAGQDVWDLYDPAPLLEHRLHDKQGDTSPDAPAEASESPGPA